MQVRRLATKGHKMHKVLGKIVCDFVLLCGIGAKPIELNSAFVVNSGQDEYRETRSRSLTNQVA